MNKILCIGGCMNGQKSEYLGPHLVAAVPLEIPLCIPKPTINFQPRKIHHYNLQVLYDREIYVLEGMKAETVIDLLFERYELNEKELHNRNRR